MEEERFKFSTLMCLFNYYCLHNCNNNVYILQTNKKHFFKNNSILIIEAIVIQKALKLIEQNWLSIELFLIAMISLALTEVLTTTGQ